MAKYQGLTYKKIIELSLTIAKKNGFEIDYSESARMLDEAMLEVGYDVLEHDRYDEIAWPASNQVNIKSSGYLSVIRAYGDATPLVYIPYNLYREMFLGTESSKPSIDNNFYYTILGNVLYVEPNVTEFTNLVLEYSPSFTEYSSSVENSEPELPYEYRILVAYKICEMACPASMKTLFVRLYDMMKKKRIGYKNKKLATGQAVFYDQFEGSTDFRTNG